ncbi:hypothetical protein DFH09DRAFT_281110 [Mycena vulgaris]|nr:hypothetical protein DFH09DRAFT_281110 [Mycena vulgaris]
MWPASKNHPTPLALPNPPPEVVSLLANNDAPDSRHIPLIEEYLSSLRRHLVAWKNTHIKSLPADSAHLIHEYDELLQSFRKSQNEPGPSVVLLRDPFHDLPPAIAQLILERDALEECVRLHAGILSPIRHLPPELIAKILESVPRPVRLSYSIEREHIPWYLAQICSRWRACALADPQMWSKISIYGDLYPRRLEKVFSVPMVKALLLMSKDISLDVSFDSGGLLNSQAEAHFLVLLNAVIEHCARWERLAFEGGSDMPIYPALSKVRLQIPRLRRLEMYWHPSVDLDWFDVAPNLQEVYLVKREARRGAWSMNMLLSVTIRIPWHQIIKYRAVYSADRHLDILRRARNLRECGLIFPQPPGYSISDAEVVEMPQLQRLRAEDCDFLDCLIAPILQELFVHRNVNAILPFLERSHAQLTSFTIFQWHLTLAIIPLLRAIPSLTHLRLEVILGFQSATDVVPVVEALARTPDLCPNLTSIMWCDESAGNARFIEYQDTFLEMIESRCRVHGLASLRLFLWDPHLQEDAAERLRSLESQGLDFSVLGASEFLEAANPP